MSQEYTKQSRPDVITVNLSKLSETAIRNACTYKDKKGQSWVRLVLWRKDEDDPYGNSVAVQAQFNKDNSENEPFARPYVGTGKRGDEATASSQPPLESGEPNF